MDPDKWWSIIPAYEKMNAFQFYHHLPFTTDNSIDDWWNKLSGEDKEYVARGKLK